MNLYEKTSKAVKVGEIYNLDHFRTAWSDERKRRLMGNESVYPPSPKVIQAVMEIIQKSNYYPEDASTNIELRLALAEYIGIPGKADWITLGNGSSEIIDMLYKAYVNEGDEILIPTPDYSPYVRRAKLYGGKTVDVLPIDEAFNYVPECFTKLINQQTKMVIASRPNNPTGNNITRDTIHVLCASDIIVVIDEAYGEFSDTSVEDMLDHYPNLIISHTFSKAMGLAGLRLGYVVGNPEMIGYINRIRVPLNISLITNCAALAALEDRNYIITNAAKIKQDREYLYSQLKTIPGLRPIPSQGNFVLINCKESGILASAFGDYLFKSGYLVRCFVNARGLKGDEYFRVSIGTHEDVEAILTKIKELIQGYSKV